MSGQTVQTVSSAAATWGVAIEVPMTVVSFSPTFACHGANRHIGARSEAHDSGLCAASAATRRQFARDLRNLTLASPQLNRYRKVAKDAAEWLPEKNRCWFAHRVVEVREAYSLTIDRHEARALDAVLATCESSEMVLYPPSAAEAALGSADEEPCGPYRNCSQLRKDHPGGVPKGHCAYQSRMDRDKDGWACE